MPQFSPRGDSYLHSRLFTYLTFPHGVSLEVTSVLLGLYMLIVFSVVIAHRSKHSAKYVSGATGEISLRLDLGQDRLTSPYCVVDTCAQFTAEYMGLRSVPGNVPVIPRSGYSCGQCRAHYYEHARVPSLRRLWTRSSHVDPLGR